MRQGSKDTENYCALSGGQAGRAGQASMTCRMKRALAAREFDGQKCCPNGHEPIKSQIALLIRRLIDTKDKLGTGRMCFSVPQVNKNYNKNRIVP
jgi:hypothetical protein